MKRKIIKIDKDLCVGCGLCVNACNEGAIGMVDGKAELLRDDYCDGLGNCLPVCPTGAISFEEREAAEYNESAVSENMEKNKTAPHSGGCPGRNAFAIRRESKSEQDAPPVRQDNPAVSQLNQWPVQIKLVPVKAHYFENANLLIAADCTAFSYADFHNRFMKNKITIIGCPKLDDGDYSEKLKSILQNNNIKSLTIARMEVPCCGGLASAAVKALQDCGKMIPWQIVTISTDGKIIDQ